ncbi:CPXCG motif-containing cysteine-rich protein [Flavobacteriaceae bacterium]|nr:CPXCG motif-containing cysteine-rich protein [Flavobacteriaceae bacterium]
MDQLEEARISCPYCGEPINVLLNPEDIGQAYIEDCQVCCRPIEMTVYWADGELGVTALSDNE